MKHVVVKFDKMIMFCNKPITKPEWVDTLKTNHFIAQRKGETLWVFDPDLDREPAAQERQSITNAANVIDVVHFGNFCTAFEEVVDVTNNNITDLLLVSDCKHRPNLSTIYKHVKKCSHELQMVVAYKEVQMSPMAGRGRRNVVEHVSIFSARPLVPVHEPRLFYTLTSCATNLMIQVDMLTPEERHHDAKRKSKKQSTLRMGFHGMNDVLHGMCWSRSCQRRRTSVCGASNFMQRKPNAQSLQHRVVESYSEHVWPMG